MTAVAAPSGAALRAQAELEWRRCAADPVWFFEKYWIIPYPIPDENGNRFRPFILREPQLQVLQVWLAGEDSITLKARQIGWSTLAAAYAFWQAFFHDDFKCLLLSKGERESIVLLAKAKYGFKKLPQWMKDRGPSLQDNTQQKMTFSNDSVIESLPSGSDPARGYTGNLLLADEFAFLANPAEAWASMEPVTDVGGQKVVLSTANGYGNLFHDLWVKAVAGISSLVPSFYGWDAVPERDQAWYEQKRAELPGWQLAQEYPSNPDEAFAKSGNMVFPYDLIKDLPIQVPSQEFELVGGAFTATVDGRLQVWEPPQAGGVYTMGGDPAEGLGHGDYSSADILTHDGIQVAHWHGHIPPDDFGVVLDALGRWYNNALAIPEVNNMGIATVITMRNLGYPNLWVREQPNKVRTQLQDEYGFKTTRITKPLIIENLHSSMRTDLVVRCERTQIELKEYVRDDHGRTNGSPFDDAVMSLALADYGRGFVHEPRYQSKPVVQEFSGEWWGKQLDPEQTSGRRMGRRNGRTRDSRVVF